MKKYLKIFILLCLVLTVSGCDQIQKSSDDTDAYRVVIADRVFKIPKGYFDGGKPFGKDSESVVLEYSLPDFEVLPPHPQARAARQELIKEGRMRGMLLEAEHNKPPFNEVMQLMMKLYDFTKSEDEVYALEKYTHNYTKPVSPDPAYAPLILDDLFIERDSNGGVKSYLRCSPPGKDKIPGCQHRFIDKGLVYDIHWRIQELPHWREQREAAIEFIDSLEQHAIQKE